MEGEYLTAALRHLPRVRRDLEPRRYFEKAGCSDEYRTWVTDMKDQRREFLARYDVAEPIVTTTVG